MKVHFFQFASLKHLQTCIWTTRKGFRVYALTISRAVDIGRHTPSWFWICHTTSASHILSKITFSYHFWLTFFKHYGLRLDSPRVRNRDVVSCSLTTTSETAREKHSSVESSNSISQYRGNNTTRSMTKRGSNAARDLEFRGVWCDVMWCD